MVPRLMRGGASFYALYGLIVLLFSLGLLVGPRVPDAAQEEYCVENVDLPGPFGFSLSCDSPDFLQQIIDPSLLLQEGATRQSRPGMILVAHLISRPVALLLEPLPEINLRAAHSSAVRYDAKQVMAAYAGYLVQVVGWFLLGAALFRSLIPQRLRYPWIVLAGCSLLVVNESWKIFLFSPHTQFFNMFVPLLLGWVAHRYLENRFTTAVRRVLLALTFGLGGLCYPTFFLFLPVLAVCMAVLALRSADWRGVVRSELPRFAYMTAAAGMPYAVWLGFVLRRTGSFYQHEMSEYRQVVWVLDRSAEGWVAIVAAVVANFVAATVASLPHVWLPLAVTFVAALLLWRHGGLATERQEILQALALGGGLFLLFVAFFAFVGILVSRLLVTAAPGLFVTMTVLCAAAWERIRAERAAGWLRAGLLAAIFAYAIYLLLNDPAVRIAL